MTVHKPLLQLLKMAGLKCDNYVDPLTFCERIFFAGWAKVVNCGANIVIFTCNVVFFEANVVKNDVNIVKVVY